MQFPFPPPVPDYIPGPLEAFFCFMLTYLLFVSCVLSILPPDWTTWAFPPRETAKQRKGNQ